jgi:cell wall-associated NlpC family hydrolase
MKDHFVTRLQMVPHVPGKGAWEGADCWGIVEIWYREKLGIKLPNRASIAPGPEGLSVGFAEVENFVRVDEPQDDCLAVMRAGRLAAGHVGVVWNGGVIHSQMHAGCIWQPFDNPMLKNRVTCFLGYRPA